MRIIKTRHNQASARVDNARTAVRARPKDCRRPDGTDAIAGDGNGLCPRLAVHPREHSGVDEDEIRRWGGLCKDERRRDGTAHHAPHGVNIYAAAWSSRGAAPW